jgi:hypothetical protein
MDTVAAAAAAAAGLPCGDANKRIKLGHDSSNEAKVFLRQFVDEEDLLLVPHGATINSMEDHFWQSWIYKLEYDIYLKVKEALSKRRTHEQVLHSQGIVFCSGAGREVEIQERIIHPISCNISQSITGDFVAKTTKQRQDNISLVLGPSGSGKTTYCVKEHGKSAHSSCDAIKHEFRVYMYATQLGDSNRKAALRELLLDEIAKALSVERNALDDVLGENTRLAMTIYAIIDEAGCDDFFGDASNLQELSRVVKEIASDGQLVVSGTGLDFLTTSIGSSGEGITKIRMLPWRLEDFNKLAKNVAISNLVAKHEVYIKMTSNARAAAYLLLWLRTTKSWGNDDDNVPFVVRGVAYDYISGNGLKDTDGSTRRQVVRAVLRLLKASEGQHICTTLPAFDEDLSPDVKRKAQSLVDVHVVNMGGILSLQNGEKYAVSVTPAITIVLAALLGTSAFMQTSWSGFEVIVALSELFKLVREAEDAPLPKFRIFQLDKPYAVKVSSCNLEVPEMTRSMVLINGSKASYADVIAPFRLIQAKHSETGGLTTLYIGDELMKMGLLTTSTTAQKVFAAEQYRIWEASDNPGAASQSNQSTASVGQPNAENAVRGLYPASTLVSKQVKTKPTCRTYRRHVDTYENEMWYRTPVAETDRTNIKSEVDRSKQLVTVVFVTNGSGFKISVSSAGKGLPTSEIFTKQCDNLFVSHGSQVVFRDLQKELIKDVVVQLAFASSAAHL